MPTLKSIKFQDTLCDEGVRRDVIGAKTLISEPPEEIDIQLVQCEVCREIIGKIDIANFKPPLHGSMFLAKDVKHGYPLPFHFSLSWVELRCPVCRKRPFYSKNYITNEKGEQMGYTHECSICQEGFLNSQALNGHMNVH